MARNNHKTKKSVESIKHTEASRTHIPTAEFQSVLSEELQSPIQVAYQRRNPDLDPQLVWRGKDLQDWSDLVVQAPPLYIQEKIQPKVLIDDLLRHTEKAEKAGIPQQLDMFADFNGLPSEAAKTEFYQHEANWSNRMILGDSLQIMASLAEREGLHGKVQCIYIDPPYGIKFNSNFQWSTTSRDVTDGKADHITREPEQVKAFRDTWRDGVHSYLTYLRDRLTIGRDLLTESGSLIIQIGDENVHNIRELMDEVFGTSNYVATISFTKTSGQTKTSYVPIASDYLIIYAKNSNVMKYRQIFVPKTLGGEGSKEHRNIELIDGTTRSTPITQDEIRDLSSLPIGSRVYATGPIVSQGSSREGSADIQVEADGKKFVLSCGPRRHWSVGVDGTKLLWKIGRLVHAEGLRIFKRFFNDFPYSPLTNVWTDTRGETDMSYVVQTSTRVIERCILMLTDPGDLVLDPTCGSGTTAFVAEQWGRRWITIDTSRVALALARARIMGSVFPYYMLSDSQIGQQKEAELNHKGFSNNPTYENIRQGFVYERVPHITLSSIANNSELFVIWEEYQHEFSLLLDQINLLLHKGWHEWEVPKTVNIDWPPQVKKIHEKWWQLHVDRRKAIDASIAANTDNEYLYDQPFQENRKVRVAGPFTIESLSPHRVLGVDENDELIDQVAEGKTGYAPGQSFEQMILENLKTAGVQQAHKEDKINFFSLTPWPGYYISAEGRYFEGDEERGRERRAGIFIGPEFGTVGRPDLVAAAREAGDAGFDVLVACALNYDARSTEFNK
ncbi:MAG: site-specific DNA-methyltransferase, partial [Anaerolineae bacterium]|nr:site-specific DNA-methyltransferase [Anaerolineae bacterium]